MVRDVAGRMIPRFAIEQWRLTHPWQLDPQIEQDLLLEAVLHRAAEADNFEQLTFIGGTCLHKLYGPGPQRYSEDLDFVWMGDGTPDDALSEIADHSRSLDFERVECRHFGRGTLPEGAVLLQELRRLALEDETGDQYDLGAVLARGSGVQTSRNFKCMADRNH